MTDIRTAFQSDYERAQERAENARHDQAVLALRAPLALAIEVAAEKEVVRIRRAAKVMGIELAERSKERPSASSDFLALSDTDYMKARS